MEYLSRLVGSASSSPTRQSAQNVGQQRLIRFKKAHDQLQQVWRKNSSAKQLVLADIVGTCLNNIKKILQDEIHAPAPHLCARHVSTFQCYAILVQVAAAYHDTLVLTQTLDIFKILIDSEEVEFLDEKGFADALINFVARLSVTNLSPISFEVETKAVETLFAIASKIRLQTQLLSTWFRPLKSGEQVAAEEHSGRDSNPRTEKDVFPLFYLILDYVHYDGRIGDFARTALLYLIESAAHSEVLEKWIVEGDLATLMASGLGALYSQLSRKLVLSFANRSVPAIVLFSEAAPPQASHDAEQTDSPQFQAHLATFLSYLAFWQDVLEHCSSVDVQQSLLDHYKLLFLQQLLYPSLIESSDIDGGSSVAVLTYLRCIIESINHVDMLHITLQYLLALPEKLDEDVASVRPTALARRRKSSVLTMTLSQGHDKPMPELFTLVDLVNTSLRSQDQQTVEATLRLVSTILHGQHSYALMSFMRIKSSNHEPSWRSMDAHTRNTAILFSMAETLIGHDDMAEAYDAHLYDAWTLVESHCCSLQLLNLPGTAAATENFPFPKDKGGISCIVQPHVPDPGDTLLQSLVTLLDNFMSNDIGTNLNLTRVFAILASCGYTRLDRWLLDDIAHQRKSSTSSVASSHGSSRDDTTILENMEHGKTATASTAVLEDSHPSNVVSTRTEIPPSSVFASLDRLTQRVEAFRHDIGDFDVYLADRRHVFKIGEDIDQAVSNDVSIPPKSKERSSAESARGSLSRSRAAAQIGSISEQLMSETSSSDVSRSNSPRGRQPSNSSSVTLVGRLNHLRISPSPSATSSTPRLPSPSPLRQESHTYTPPRQAPTPIGPAGALRQKIRVRVTIDQTTSERKDTGSETSSMKSQSTTAEAGRADQGFKDVPLSHLLTNVVILQEFILELAAIIEVRASLFGEVKVVRWSSSSRLAGKSRGTLE